MPAPRHRPRLSASRDSGVQEGNRGLLRGRDEPRGGTRSERSRRDCRGPLCEKSSIGEAGETERTLGWRRARGSGEREGGGYGEPRSRMDEDGGCTRL